MSQSREVELDECSDLVLGHLLLEVARKPHAGHVVMVEGRICYIAVLGVVIGHIP